MRNPAAVTLKCLTLLAGLMMALPACVSGHTDTCSASGCPAGRVCVGGACLALCTSSHDCAPSETCTDGVCGPGGSVCAANSDCPDLADMTCMVVGSGYCEGGYCRYVFAGANATCDDGDNCTSDDHCERGTCVGTLVCNFPDGSACTGPTECASGHCESALCCPEGGDCCHDDGECAYGRACDVAALLCYSTCATLAGDDNSRCQAGYHCDAGGCLENLQAYSWCDEDSDCVDGRCDSHICCEGSEDCCATNEDCGGSWGCNIATHVCYASCTFGDDTSCKLSGFCNTSGACQDDLDIGGLCGTDNGACLSGRCDSGHCCALGADCCTNSTDCASNFACNTGTGVCYSDCTAGNQTTNCKPSVVCASGSCGSGAAVGSTCTSGSDCASGSCSPAAGSPRYCCPPGGYCCRADSDCPGEYACNTTTHICYGSTGCTAHSDCKSSGYCMSGLNQCVTDSTLHQTCSFPEMCATGICESGVCCGVGEDCCLSDSDCAGYYGCDTVNHTCFKSCSGTTTNCKSTGYCSNTACIQRKGQGTNCANAYECGTGFCVDGRCCNEACGSTCRTCNPTWGGGTSPGTCYVIPAGLDPNSECTLSACSGDFCSGDASVSGTSHCQYVASGAAPNAGFTCAGTCKTATCNGSGSCGSAPDGKSCRVEGCTLTCSNGTCADTVCGSGTGNYCCDCGGGEAAACVLNTAACSTYCGTTTTTTRFPCFIAGTPVAMADGTSRAIDAINVGERVLSFDEETGAIVTARVTEVYVHPRTAALVSINHGRITTTPEHRFRVAGRWVHAADLTVGDELTHLGDVHTAAAAPTFGSWPVTAIESLAGGVTTYNLEVEGTHTYFVDGILVHNSKP